MAKHEARRYEVINNLIAGMIDGTEAAKLLNRSVRQIQRIKKVVCALGISGVIHGNRGKSSHNKIDPNTLERAKRYLHERYHDFNPLLAQEHLRDDHRITLSKETVRQLMIAEKLWKSRKRGYAKPKHQWRERKDNYGEMQQFDGSYHNWFEGRNAAVVGLEQCLLVSVDDATGIPTQLQFEDNEGVHAVFRFWKNYFETHGFPLCIYLDKFSTYKVNHKNAVDNAGLITQFKRAMDQLGVGVINANSPQAKGRVEKMNGTLQRRLVKELRLRNINTIPEANIFLKECFIPKFSEQFAVAPKKEADLHRKLDGKSRNELARILSIQSERVVSNDYTIRFNNSYYQLVEVQPTTVLKQDRVTIEEHLNGELKIVLRNSNLNYILLPERPKKEIDVKLVALTCRKPTGHTPDANHPWKKRFLINKKRPIGTVAR